jgi:hypothetical protein
MSITLQQISNNNLEMQTKEDMKAKIKEDVNNLEMQTKEDMKAKIKEDVNNLEIQTKEIMKAKINLDVNNLEMQTKEDMKTKINLDFNNLEMKTKEDMKAKMNFSDLELQTKKDMIAKLDIINDDLESKTKADMKAILKLDNLQVEPKKDIVKINNIASSIEYPKIVQFKNIYVLIHKITLKFGNTKNSDNVEMMLEIVKDLVTLSQLLDGIKLKEYDINAELDKIKNKLLENSDISSLKEQLHIAFDILQSEAGDIVKLMKINIKYHKKIITLLSKLKILINSSNRIDNNFIMIYFTIKLIGKKLSDPYNYYKINEYVTINQLIKFTDNYYISLKNTNDGDTLYKQKLEEFGNLNKDSVDEIKKNINSYISSKKTYKDMKMYVEDYLVIMERDSDKILM